MLGVPVEELRDLRVPLEDLWGPAGREAARAGRRRPGSRCSRALARRLREAAPDPRVLAAARRLDRAPGTRVPALADALGSGERQLRRRFTEGVGYGPKTFARIARFRAAVACCAAAPPRPRRRMRRATPTSRTSRARLVALAGAHARGAGLTPAPVRPPRLTVPSSWSVQ